ncbi:MAG: prefoldin subunit alpha [Candidatus Hadarchaeales archaeon]
MSGLTEEEESRLREISAQIEEGGEMLGLIRRQISALGNAVNEIGVTIEALKKLRDTKEGTQILVPVGPGAFLPALTVRADKVLLDIGADVAVERSFDDAIKFLENRSVELQQAMTSLGAEAIKLDSRLEKLVPERDALMNKALAEK